MIAKFTYCYYPVIDETWDKIQIFYCYEIVGKTGSILKKGYIKHWFYKPGMGEEIDEVNELIGVEDY